jgi:leucyl-tRNA synthetase
MELTNQIAEYGLSKNPADVCKAITREAIKTLILLLSPFAPHICKELWAEIGEEGLISFFSWPVANTRLLEKEETLVVVQINGKLRGRLTVPIGLGQEEVEKMAHQDPTIQKHLAKKTIRKVIYVTDKLLNIVVG